MNSLYKIFYMYYNNKYYYIRYCINPITFCKKKFISSRNSLKKDLYRFFFILNIYSFEKLTVATPCTWAVVPSGKVIIGVLGSTCIIETVPSGLVIVCNTVVGYWAVIC